MRVTAWESAARKVRGDSVDRRFVTMAPNCVAANPPGSMCVMRVNSVLAGSCGSGRIMFALMGISMRVYPALATASGCSSPRFTTSFAPSPMSR